MPTTPAQPVDNIYPEDHDVYEKLAKLQSVYAQIFELRTLLPDKLVDPTQTVLNGPNGVAPQKVAAKLRNAAMTGSKNIQSFKADYQSEVMRNLWQDVNTSEFPQGEDVWTRDYTELAKNSNSEHGEDVEKEHGDDQGNRLVIDGDIAVLKNFHESNATCTASSLEEGRALPLELTVVGVAFKVERIYTDDVEALRVKSKHDENTPQEVQDIVKHIKENHASVSLESILSLLSSYKDMKTMPCQECGKVFDMDLQFAVVRKEKERTSKDDTTVWIPFHQSCMS